MKELEELREIVKLAKELEKLGILHQTAEALKAKDLTPKNNNNKFTEDEKVILRNLPKGYKYIARDKDNDICIYSIKPFKNSSIWDAENDEIYYYLEVYNDMFKSIQWEDEEPCEFRKYL